MKKITKLNLWIGGFVGPWMALNAESVQVNTETKGEITTIKMSYHRDDGATENEEIQLRKEADHWGLVSKRLLDEANFDLSNPTDARCLVDGLELKLRSNGDLYLSGEYAGDLMVDHSGKVAIAKDQSFKISQNLFLNRAILFENAGTLEVGKNWLCLLSAVKNSGAITVKQGWQVMALQTFENAAPAKFTMLRADILSPATKVTNQGQMDCLMDFNGEPCDFINHAGEMHVGGNCTLKSLVNKSETEPAINGSFVETERILTDPNGNKIQSGDGRYFLLNYTGGFWHDPKGSNTPGNYGGGFRASCLGCKRIITCTQNFTKKEGKGASLNIQGQLLLKQPSQVVCSSVYVSELTENVALKGYATNKQIVTYVLKNREAPYFRGNFFGGGGRTCYGDGFINTGTQNAIHELIHAHLEVLGTVTGKVETFINGKADAAQPGVVKATEAALDKIAESAEIFPMLADPEGYEADLKELKANPGFATMVRLQEMRRARSEVASVVPSRQSSPGMEE